MEIKKPKFSFLEKLPSTVTKYVVFGIIIFISVILGLFVKDLLVLKYMGVHYRYFTAECNVYNTTGYVKIIAKENIENVKVYDLNNNYLCGISYLTKNSADACSFQTYKISIPVYPVKIKYSIDNENRSTIIDCNVFIIEPEKKVSGNVLSLISKVLGI